MSDQSYFPTLGSGGVNGGGLVAGQFSTLTVGVSGTSYFSVTSAFASLGVALVPSVDNAIVLGTIGNRFLSLNVGTTGIRSDGPISYPGGGAAFIRANAAATSFGAAQVGTLTNAPSAGNPTKWLFFDDAGTGRFIPAW